MDPWLWVILGMVAAVVVIVVVIVVTSGSTATPTPSPVEQTFTQLNTAAIGADALISQRITVDSDLGRDLRSYGGGWASVGTSRSVFYEGTTEKGHVSGAIGAGGYVVLDGTVSSPSGTQVAYSIDAIRVIRESPLTVLCRDGLRVFEDGETLILEAPLLDAYVSGSYIVALSDNQVIWLMSDVEIAHWTVRGACIREVSGPVVAVGVPSEEQIEIVRPEGLMETIEIGGDKGNSGFGTSLCISGDNMVVGAPLEGPGTIYFYERSGGTWVYIERVDGTQSDRDRNQFGIQVVFTGSENTVAVAHGNFDDDMSAIDIVSPVHIA